MKAIMETGILPRLMGSLEQVIIHRTILTEGIGESMLASKIEAWENALPTFIKLAYLPQPGMVRLRLTAYGTDREMLQTAMDKAEKELMPLAGDYIFGYDDDTMESVIGNLLKSKRMTLATAESCTGGNISQLITSIAGSSDYFKGAVIAYSNEIKEQILGVPHQTLVTYGAVSEETVTAMAANVRERFGTDFAIAVSGIAGPDGGTAEKPVGTIWICIATEKETVAKKFLFGEHRGRNIRRASLSALNMLRGVLISQE